MLENLDVRICARLRQLASRYVGYQDADDIVQDAFLSALRGGNAFKGNAQPTTWLHRIVVNAGLDEVRRRSARRRQQATALATAVEARPDFVRSLSTRRALRELPARYRQVILMHDLMGYSHKEIASKLHIAPGTSKSRLWVARHRFRMMDPA